MVCLPSPTKIDFFLNLVLITTFDVDFNLVSLILEILNFVNWPFYHFFLVHVVLNDFVTENGKIVIFLNCTKGLLKLTAQEPKSTSIKNLMVTKSHQSEKN